MRCACGTGAPYPSQPLHLARRPKVPDRLLRRNKSARRKPGKVIPHRPTSTQCVLRNRRRKHLAEVYREAGNRNRVGMRDQEGRAIGVPRAKFRYRRAFPGPLLVSPVVLLLSVRVCPIWHTSELWRTTSTRTLAQDVLVGPAPMFLCHTGCMNVPCTRARRYQLLSPLSPPRSPLLRICTSTLHLPARSCIIR